jgi:lipopolysaccharide/colanic/teichoic acid biosynthesis glycosyltransferase
MVGITFSTDQSPALLAAGKAHLPKSSNTATSQSGLLLSWCNGRPVSHKKNATRRVQLIFKRVVDICVAVLALLALLPLFAVVALAIKIESRGPILFRQRREGLNGELFSVLKFRSMPFELGDPSGLAQTMTDDPRVTGLGRFIRRTSIDELPQLFNVLVGDMSLVGPRPHVPGMIAAGVPYKALVPYYNDRLVMRPGITGWAQANGLRGSTVEASASRSRVDHDIAYIQNFSVLLDLKILVKTVVAEFVTGTGR